MCEQQQKLSSLSHLMQICFGVPDSPVWNQWFQLYGSLHIEKKAFVPDTLDLHSFYCMFVFFVERFCFVAVTIIMAIRFHHLSTIFLTSQNLISDVLQFKCSITIFIWYGSGCWSYVIFNFRREYIHFSVDWMPVFHLDSNGIAVMFWVLAPISSLAINWYLF